MGIKPSPRIKEEKCQEGTSKLQFLEVFVPKILNLAHEESFILGGKGFTVEIFKKKT
jgi:hypothetical protein